MYTKILFFFQNFFFFILDTKYEIADRTEVGTEEIMTSASVKSNSHNNFKGQNKSSSE